MVKKPKRTDVETSCKVCNLRVTIEIFLTARFLRVLSIVLWPFLDIVIGITFRNGLNIDLLSLGCVRKIENIEHICISARCANSRVAPPS